MQNLPLQEPNSDLSHKETHQTNGGHRAAFQYSTFHN